MPALRERERVFRARGAAADLIFDRREDEVVLAGPAGTGKSRACLEYVHKQLIQYPGSRALALRKTHISLVESAVVTYREKVLDPADGVSFYGGSQQEPAAFRYPNGSRLLLGGMDRPGKVMSKEYDLIYVQEATELNENEWETLTTRLRWGVMPVQQLVGDCNPDAPTHWLKRRGDAGKTVLLESRHEDNPSVTPEYLAKLDALTGVRYLRLRLGLWAAAEGMVYEAWDRAIHLVDRFEIPGTWPRYWSVDFGYTNPFVWQCWAEDYDGRLYLEREIYRTQRLVEDHARDILRVTARLPRPQAIYCDHDAEDRATLERHLEMTTEGAYKAVSPGLQAVASRLRPAGDGLPRLVFFRDALVERDPALDESKRPASTVEEFDGYVWDTANGRRTGEAPVKRDDHGMDALRYMVATKDRDESGGASEIYDRYGRKVG